MKNKTKIGLVASTGGLNTFAALGVINFIKEHNIQISACAASSGGAFPLAAYCCGIDTRSLQPDRIANELKHSFFDPDRFGLTKLVLKLLAYVAGFNVKDPLKGLEAMGYCKGESLLQLLKDKFGDLTFKDTLIPLYITSWNINEKRQDIFHSDGLNTTIAEAIRMTSSIPLIFRPYMHNHNLYWDGGIASSLPVKELLEHEPDINLLILIDTISGNDLVLNPLAQPMSLLHALNDIVIGIQNTQITESVDYAVKKLGDENVIILAPPHRCGWDDFSKIPEIIQDGYQLTKNAFRYNKKLHAAFEMHKQK